MKCLLREVDSVASYGKLLNNEIAVYINEAVKQRCVQMEFYKMREIKVQGWRGTNSLS